MTVPYNADLYQAVLPGGQVTFQQQFETYYGSGIEQAVTGTTITITPVGNNQAPVVGPTTADVVQIDNATYSYVWSPPVGTEPGDYTAVFSAAGPSGTITYTQAVTVAQPPSPFPNPGMYATVTQYQAWSGDLWTPSQVITPILRKAATILDHYLVGAVYAIDANSMPTDPGVIDVFMRATCAQCEFMLANNDPAFVKSQYSSTSVGGVSAVRTASAQDQAFPPLAPMAAAILHTAGVVPGAPLVNW